MARASSASGAARLALCAVLGFAACMPPSIEVGRESEVEPRAGTGGTSSSCASPTTGGTSAGEPETSFAGAEPDAGSANVGRAGSPGEVSSGNRPAASGGRGGAPPVPAASSGVGGGASGVNGVSGSFGTAATGAIGGAPSTGTIGGAMSDCPTDGSDDVVWPIEVLCAFYACPTSVADAEQSLQAQFGDCAAVRNELRTGCDAVQISATSDVKSQVYVFRGAPLALTGVAFGGNMPWGPCRALRYYGGEAPRGCDSATSCTFCGPGANCN